MSGVETLFDDMLKEDAEYQRLRKVKGLIDINEFREKYSTATEDFKCDSQHASASLVSARRFAKEFPIVLVLLLSVEFLGSELRCGNVV